MKKNLSLIFLVAILLCVCVYIGVFIGRTSVGNTIHISSIVGSNDTELEKIDINKATVQELKELPGVSTTVANAIVEYRSKYGRYYKVKELLDVDGVTEALYESIKDYVVAGSE